MAARTGHALATGPLLVYRLPAGAEARGKKPALIIAGEKLVAAQVLVT